MVKLTKAVLIDKIKANTGLTSYKAKKGLKAALSSIKRALADGKQVDIPGVGRLVVVERKQERAIRKNMKGPCPMSIVDLHKKHPKSVRLLRGKDLSEDPKPTIIYKNPKPEPAPARSRHFRVAVPSWRRFR